MGTLKQCLANTGADKVLSAEDVSAIEAMANDRFGGSHVRAVEAYLSEAMNEKAVLVNKIRTMAGLETLPAEVILEERPALELEAETEEDRRVREAAEQSALSEEIQDRADLEKEEADKIKRNAAMLRTQQGTMFGDENGQDSLDMPIPEENYIGYEPKTPEPASMEEEESIPFDTSDAELNGVFGETINDAEMEDFKWWLDSLDSFRDAYDLVGRPAPDSPEAKQFLMGFAEAEYGAEPSLVYNNAAGRDPEGYDYYLTGYVAGRDNEAPAEAYFVSEIADGSWLEVAPGSEPDVPFSKRIKQNRAQRTGMHTEIIRNRLKDGLGNIGGVEVKLVHSPDDTGVKGLDDTVEAFYDAPNNTIYMIGSQIDSPERATSVWAHEVFGHVAMEELPEFSQIVIDVAQQLSTKPGELQAALDYVTKTQPNLQGMARAEEVIAVIAEQGTEIPLMRRIVNAVREFLRRVGIVTEFTESDLRGFVAKAARKYLAKGPVKAKPASEMTDRQVMNKIRRMMVTKYPLDPETDFLTLSEPTESVRSWWRSIRDNDNAYMTLVTHAPTASISPSGNMRFQPFDYPGVEMWLRGQARDTSSPDAVRSGEMLRRVQQQMADAQGLRFAKKKTRLERARDMGFDTNTVLYHGTTADFESFELGMPKKNGVITNAIHLTDNPEVAEDAINADGVWSPEGGNIIKVYVRGKSVTHDIQGQSAGNSEVQRLIEKARADGFDVVRLENASLRFAAGTEVVVFDPANIRSTNAQFNEAGNGLVFSKRPSMSPEYEDIRDRKITKADANKTLTEKVGELYARWRNYDLGFHFLENIVDESVALSTAERALNDGKLLEGEYSSYKAINLTKNLSQQMAAIFRHGALELRQGVFSIIEDGRLGIDDIFSQLYDANGDSILEIWEDYAIAKRAKFLLSENRPDGTQREKLFTEEEADLMINEIENSENGEKIKKVWKEYHQFRNQQLDEAVRVGAMDAGIKAMLENNDWAPMHRALDISESDEWALQKFAKGARSGHTGGGGISGQKVQFKRLFGSERMVDGNVFENMMMNAAYVQNMMNKHVAMRKTVSVFEGTALTHLKMKPEAVHFSNEQLASVLESAGFIIEPPGYVAPDSQGDLIGGGASDHALSVVKKMTAEQKEQWSALFRMQAPVGPDVVSVMDNAGKMQYYKVEDPAIYRAVTSMGVDSFANLFTTIFGAPKRFLTDMVTADPAFMMANFARDTLAAFIQSDVSLIPVADSVKGFGAAWNEDPLLWEMMAAGAGGGGYYARGDKDLRQMIKQKVPAHEVSNHMKSIVHLNSQNAVWKLLQRIGSASENANRLAVARKVIDGGASPAEAAYQFLDVLNFSRHGASRVTQALIATVPFLNPRIQGLYKMFRSSQDHGRGVALKGMTLTGLSLALWFLNSDDERYRELEEWDKETYWHVFTDDGHYRIPKPFEWGVIFGSIPERFMDSATGKEGWDLFAERLGAMVVGQLNMNPMPQAIKPIVEQYMNKSMFTGRPIVGEGLSYLPPEDQFTSYTSETFIALADGMPDWAPDWLRSPKRLEAFYRGYTATMGMYALSAADGVARQAGDYPEKPEMRLWDYPIASRFVRPPVPFSSRYQAELYEMSGEANGLAQKITRLRQTGEFKEADAVRVANADKLQARVRLNRIKRDITGYNKQLLKIYSSDLAPPEKARRADQIKKQRNDKMREVKDYLQYF